MIQRFAPGLLILGLALLAWSFVPGYGPQYTVFAGTQLNLAADDNAPITQISAQFRTNAGTAEERVGDPRPLPSVPADEGTVPEGQVAYSLKGLKVGWHYVAITRSGKDANGVAKTMVETIDLQILHTQYGFMAAAGALLAIVAAPLVLITNTRLYGQKGASKVPLTGWIYLLMEPSGLSLARLQLIILFVPAAVVYLALSFPLHEFPHLPDSVWQLLGIGGATAALSTLITPAGKQVEVQTSLPLPESFVTLSQQASDQQASSLALPASQPTVSAAPTTTPQDPTADVVVPLPTATDLFAEGNGYGDISRYQSFIMCSATAVVFAVSFFDTWSMPDIPDQILQLLGMSLAVYLGVKGIKVVKKPA